MEGRGGGEKERKKKKERRMKERKKKIIDGDGQRRTLHDVIRRVLGTRAKTENKKGM